MIAVKAFNSKLQATLGSGIMTFEPAASARNVQPATIRTRTLTTHFLFYRNLCGNLKRG